MKEPDLLTPAEVARMFGVDPKSVTRWANAGLLSCVRTLGGHRRYRADEVARLIEKGSQQPAAHTRCPCVDRGPVYSNVGDPDHDGSPDYCDMCDDTGIIGGSGGAA